MIVYSGKQQYYDDQYSPQSSLLIPLPAQNNRGAWVLTESGKKHNKGSF